MKIGPIIAMAAALTTSVWVVLSLQRPSASPTPGSTQLEVIIDRRKVQFEQIALEQGGYEYRFLNFDQAGDKRMSASEFERVLATEGADSDRGALLKALNVSGYGQLAWVGLGLLGQLLFSGRMILQWITSERKNSSVVPPAFWYMSLGGGVLLVAYFIWRLDLVGVLGQSSGIVIYARNIRLLAKQRRAAGLESAVSTPKG